MDLLRYNLGEGVEAFTTRRDSVLPYPVIQPHQTHSANVAVIDRPDYSREELEGVDALVTNLKNVAIGVRTADCIPVLLYDPVSRCVGAAHSGWRGADGSGNDKELWCKAFGYACRHRPGYLYRQFPGRRGCGAAFQGVRFPGG